jgi:chemotaxis protein histidine kinase CheA
MNLVGELVLTRNQIAQFSARQTDAAFMISTQQLNLLTSELQEEVMKTRMQPISNVFDKFPRVVRDVAMSCGKQVLIEMEGKQTEIDKSLLEAIKDPLTHIVRNSVDHGIEMPDVRVARGKRPEGHIKLRACHEGGQVLIEISDDGAGIPQVSIRELVRLDGDRVSSDIEMVHGVPVYRMRGRLLPLVYLREELKLAKHIVAQADQDTGVNIVVLQADDHPFGLVVDEINDSEEIVVKPLSKQLKGVKVFAGATIMGDGRAALILDVVGLAQNASILSEVRDRALAETAEESTEKQDQVAIEKQTFLLFAGPDDGRMALPLGALARLEEFPAPLVEKSGNEWVVQYRGKILPLIRLDIVLAGC